MIRIKQKKTILSLVFAFVAVIAVAFLFSGCSKEENYRLVKVQSYDGAVTVQREEKLNAFEGLQLITNDTVSVGDKSFLELLADSDKHIAAEENTGFVLHSTGDENSGDITIDLLYGKSFFTIDNNLNEDSTFAVNTPNATLSVRGTYFSAAYDEETKTTEVEVFSGTVQLNSGDEELLIEKDGTASIISTDEGVKIIANSTAGNPNAIAVPENTEKLFEIAMTYPQEEGYNATNAEYRTIVSDYTANETKADSNSKIFKKYIEIIKSHDSEISKFFEENKANAVANTNKQADVTDWFGEMLSVKDKGFRIDKAIMDMSIYGSNINKKYVTSDTYRVNTDGVDMYFCANGVEISFYGGFEEVEPVDEGPILKQITERYYNADGTLDRMTVSDYDSEGKYIKRTYYDENENLDHYQLPEYDENGKLVGDAQYYRNSNGEPTSYNRYEYEYNSDERLTKWICHYGENRTDTDTYEYDSNGMYKTIYHESYQKYSGGSESTIRYKTNYEYVLDSEGRVLEETLDAEYEYTDEHHINIYKFNEHGDIIESTSKTVDADIYTHDYIYDDYGFCTKEVTYKNGVLDSYYTYERIFWDESELQ